MLCSPLCQRPTVFSMCGTSLQGMTTTSFPPFRMAYECHESTRYITVILNLQKIMYRVAIAADITNMILKKHSVKGSDVEYWSKEEQEQKLEAAFVKWSEKGTVWSAAAMQVSSLFALPPNLCADPTMIRCTGNSSGMFERDVLNVAVRTFCPTAAISKDPTRNGIACSAKWDHHPHCPWTRFCPPLQHPHGL